QGKRVTTLEVEMPRMVLAEFNTHRMFSRNSASSRAIPVHKQLLKLLEEPFVPERFGRNQPGMQSHNWLEGDQHEEARAIWLRARDRAASAAFEMLLGEKLAGEIFGYDPEENSFATLHQLQIGFDDAVNAFNEAMKVEDPADTEILGVHKQIANRLLEPFMWHTVVVTATEWSNFMALRIDEHAQAEIRKPAELMLEALETSIPEELGYGEWHVPFIQPDEKQELETEVKVKVSCARCARTSYLTQNGVRDLSEDTKMYTRLAGPGHMSPMEHPCRPIEEGEEQKGNLLGWHQHRADLPNEDDFGRIKAMAA
ncbi:MAG: FAD-dependent thymidylate synthase, partial [Candidatus Saccharibacteria bacterium]|nr:FAD-dependent thymidylate synthase [Candidatus Saccharibacteria bacterium]